MAAHVHADSHVTCSYCGCCGQKDVYWHQTPNGDPVCDACQKLLAEDARLKTPEPSNGKAT